MIAHSYSRLSTFEQCEAKYDFIYHSKQVKDAGNQYTDYGSRVHEKLEAYAKAPDRGMVLDLHLDAEIKDFVPLVERVLDQPGEKLFEYQMALRRDKTPCDWFASDVWLRGIADVLVINGDAATALDWKTGKVRDNPVQLKLFAAMVMSCFPQVQNVRAAFVWLAHNDLTDYRYKREHLDDIWASLEPRFERVEDTVAIGMFKTRPSGLCRWCPAKDICGDARK